MARLHSNLTKIAANAPKFASEALLQTADDIYKTSQQLVPVDTSSLKRSGGVEVVDSHNVNIGYGVAGVFIDGREPAKYARYQEFGTSRTAAQPYLVPAFSQNTKTFKVRLAEAVNKEANAQKV